MKLAEALLLIPELNKKIGELRIKRREVSIACYREDDKENTITKHDMTVDECTEEIVRLSECVRIIRHQIGVANTTYKIPWKIAEGEDEIYLGQAVTLIRQMRDGQEYLNQLKNTKTTSHVVDPSMTSRLGRISSTGAKDWSYKEVNEATFDVAAYKTKAEQNEKAIQKLNNMIQAKNWEIDIPFEYTY